MLSGVNTIQNKSHFETEKTLYVGNLGEFTFDNELFKFFTSNGHNPAMVKVVMDKAGGSRKYGYLNFRTEDEALKCLEKMNNIEMNGKQLNLSRKRESEFNVQANLLVKNLPETTTQNDLLKMFEEFGKIVSCKLEVNPDGKSRMFGYVQFEKAEEAQ